MMRSYLWIQAKPTMGAESQVGTLIAILTGIFTYQGLTHSSYQNKYLLHVDSILVSKEYYRLFSSGFLHANWMHFGFNMAALVSFAMSIEILLGIKSFLIIYCLSLLGGSLLALYIHRNHADYSGVGASGANLYEQAREGHISRIIWHNLLHFRKFAICF